MPSARFHTALRLLSSHPNLEGMGRAPKPRPRLAFSLHEEGFLQGGLTHLDGPAATEAALRFLAEQGPALNAAWVEARLTAYPPGFAQIGVRLDALLFVEAREHFPWSLLEVVRSQSFGVVAAASPLPDALALRRLQSEAERAACAVLLTASLPPEAWPVRARWWCRRRGPDLRITPAGAPGEGGAADPSLPALRAGGLP